MAKGLSPSDWTVRWDGKNGIVSCSLYAGRFTVLRTGVIRLVWVSGPGPRTKYGAIGRAAKEAADVAVNG